MNKIRRKMAHPSHPKKIQNDFQPTSHDDLTAREKQIVAYEEQFQATKGHQPSQRVRSSTFGRTPPTGYSAHQVTSGGVTLFLKDQPCPPLSQTPITKKPLIRLLSSFVMRMLKSCQTVVCQAGRLLGSPFYLLSRVVTTQKQKKKSNNSSRK